MCFKCNEIKSLDEFHRHSQMADGHLNKCKPCARMDVSANRHKRIDYYRAFDKLRNTNNPIRAAKKNETSRKWQQQDVRRRRSHSMVARAVKKGLLIPLPCEICGTTENIHAHHDDYGKPLNVIWLCPIDHKKRHALLIEAGLNP